MAGQPMATETKMTPLEFAARDVAENLTKAAEELVASIFLHMDFGQNPETLQILQLTALRAIVDTASSAVMAAPQTGELPSLTYKALVAIQSATTNRINAEFDVIPINEQGEIGKVVTKFRSVILPPSRRR